MAIVYIHRRKDIEDPFLNVFYVGIGSFNTRAFSKYSRNKYWGNIIKKHEYITEITHNDILIEEAYAIEKYLISFYGRHDLGLGNLANMTDGGEGIVNLSEEARKKMSESRIGSKNHMFGRRGENHPLFGYKPSDETKLKLEIKRLRGKNHPMYGKKGTFSGKTHTKEARKKISESKKGEKNPMYGKSSPSYGMLGKKHSEETRKKMAIAQKIRFEKNPLKKNGMLGKKHTPETILKIKLACEKRKQKKYENSLFDASCFNGGNASICTEKDSSNP